MNINSTVQEKQPDNRKLQNTVQRSKSQAAIILIYNLEPYGLYLSVCTCNLNYECNRKCKQIF